MPGSGHKIVDSGQVNAEEVDYSHGRERRGEPEVRHTAEQVYGSVVDSAGASHEAGRTAGLETHTNVRFAVETNTVGNFGSEHVGGSGLGSCDPGNLPNSSCSAEHTNPGECH